MFEKIISFSVRHKLIAAIFTLAIVGGGMYSLEEIPIDAVPDITNNQVQVVTRSPSLTAEEVERFITYPIEVSMANLPGVVELRSISRYGLSVVTIVFEDGMPVTDTRQFVSEQIDIAAEEIPDGLGRPELMPITTGLGEVYQYTLEVDPAFGDTYNAIELRTIQDWIVKRQLSGIEGVVEVSSFGGFLRQVQVSVDPIRLGAVGLTIDDVLSSLSANNQNTGGSYVERGTNALYIRSEGMIASMDDLRRVVVKPGNPPVLLEQVATVEEGFPPRYGAMTKNGQGEAVGGIVLMLRDANSSKTIENIHARVAEVQRSLPEGVRIVPYLDRSELVGRTTSTVKTNLIEGGLIVIFVLVLLLGNLRAGFIVASVIPLSLMFAFMMMNIFGVSANLMSLGALDFGIVVDGAVIVVEGVLHALAVHHVGRSLTRDQLDDVVTGSASSIYKSAAFGVLIIIVVFIPIMTLTGIEGKMFRPMAQTVSFAVLGALILSITYVPMMSALILHRKIEVKDNFSNRIVRSLQRIYEPIVRKALGYPRATTAIAVALLAVAVFLFTRLGGVFIPTLEEGDIAMQMTLPTGSSLKESIRTTTQAERILLENFPEVRQVVSKIGTAEVPTDPMSVELADIMIVMKDKGEWTSAETRPELIEKMEEKLSAILGASFDFTQPIQLRFNELMTGAKTDVAVKIFGEDLDILQAKAREAAEIVSEIQGAADIVVEQTEGLPQVLVQYDRQRLAQHGVDIADLNSIVRTAFAGEQAGVIFEGERKFDLTVRLSETHRADFNLNNLFVRNSGGHLIPVAELARIEQVVAPAQISRDDARRRITLGINVRGRDIESLVQEVQQQLDARLDLPSGYYIRYGGDFENLQRAKDRLIIAVPIALLLILVLLYFAFGSLPYALLIFAAVPLSAIGGVLSLWIRGLPFSISAGVGFIALFGVAVLNGIVLVSYFNQLKEEGRFTLDELIVRGGLVRLRPVITTASVAALGFLPMAISTTAGAEVQRPLATVVIGGLVSATMLTLVVLPVLYRSVERLAQRKRSGPAPAAIAILLAFVSIPAVAQNRQPLMISEQEAVDMALEQNPESRMADLALRRAEVQRKSATLLPPANIGLQYGQINSDQRDPFVEISQGLGSIPSHIYRAAAHKHHVRSLEHQRIITHKELARRVRIAWNEWLYRRQVARELDRQLTFYQDFTRKADLQYRTGEQSLLEIRMIESTVYELRNTHSMGLEQARQAMSELQFLLATNRELIPAADTLIRLESKADTAFADQAFVAVFEERVEASRAETAVQKSLFFPEISVGYFRQSITETDARFRGMRGFLVGVSVPLWFRPQQANLQRARIDELHAVQELELVARSLENTRYKALSDLRTYGEQLSYYDDHGLDQAEAIRRNAALLMEAGEIDFFQFLQSLERYTQTRLQFLEAVRNYNRAIIEVEYLSQP